MLRFGCRACHLVLPAPFRPFYLSGFYPDRFFVDVVRTSCYTCVLGFFINPSSTKAVMRSTSVVCITVLIPSLQSRQRPPRGAVPVPLHIVHWRRATVCFLTKYSVTPSKGGLVPVLLIFLFLLPMFVCCPCAKPC